MVNEGREVLIKQNVVLTKADDILDSYVPPTVKEADSGARYSYSPIQFKKIIGSRYKLTESGERKQPLAKCRSTEQHNANYASRYKLQFTPNHIQPPKRTPKLMRTTPHPFSWGGTAKKLLLEL
jgi:hypothetical protein